MEELVKILNDWLVLYADALSSGMVIKIAELIPNVYVLKISADIDDSLFFYLVNYCAYPIGFEKNFEAEGYLTAKDDKALLNKKILVFINETDPDAENVWIVTEKNETYKYDFGGNLEEKDFNRKYKELDIGNPGIIYEQISINIKKILEKAKKERDHGCPIKRV